MPRPIKRRSVRMRVKIRRRRAQGAWLCPERSKREELLLLRLAGRTLRGRGFCLSVPKGRNGAALDLESLEWAWEGAWPCHKVGGGRPDGV